MLWTARPDTTLDYVNQTVVNFTGRPLEQLLDEGWLDFVHPDDVAPSRDTYMPAIEAHRPSPERDVEGHHHREPNHRPEGGEVAVAARV